MANPRYIKDDKPTPLLDFLVKATKYVYHAEARQLYQNKPSALEKALDIDSVHIIGSQTEKSYRDYRELLLKIIPKEELEDKSDLYDQLQKRLRTGVRRKQICAAIGMTISPPHIDITNSWNDFDADLQDDALIEFKFMMAKYFFEAEVAYIAGPETPSILNVENAYAASTEPVEGEKRIFGTNINLVVPKMPEHYAERLNAALDKRLHTGPQERWITVRAHKFRDGFSKQINRTRLWQKTRFD